MKKAAWRRSRKLCGACGERWARFRHRGQVRWEPHHSLCFECYRAIRNRYPVVRPGPSAAWAA